MNGVESCENCKFFASARSASENPCQIGPECHKSPPILWVMPGNENNPSFHGMWPATRPQFWCGAWEPGIKIVRQ